MSCLLFLTAVIASQGAYHLILGENRGVLTHGYYVDYERLTEDEFRTVRSYYDFLVRYCTLLYDPELKDVSMTHAGGDNQEYRFADFDYSMYCRPGRVWCIIREKPGLKIVSHINFCGIHDDRWNEGQEEPVALFNLTITIQLLESVKSVFIASPDTDSGKPQPIDYKTVQGPRGKYIQVKIPELRRWSLLVVRTTS